MRRLLHLFILSLALAVGIHSVTANDSRLAEHEVYELAAVYDWDAEKAVRVALCESSYDTYATNRAGPYRGLMQVWDRHVKDASSLYDPETNMAVAYRLYQERGWRPWPVCGRK